MYQYYLQYWKQFFFGLIVLFYVFQIDSENDLLLIVIFIFTVYFISSYLKTPKGIKNDLDAVTKYLDKETNLDLKNGKCLNYPDIAEALIIRGANINATYMRGETPLHTAVLGKDNFEVVKVTIDRGADINAYEKSQGKTPLHKAAYYGHTDIAELLILNGAKVNFRNFSGHTPLTSAETGEHSEMYSLLVRYGATY